MSGDSEYWFDDQPVYNVTKNDTMNDTYEEQPYPDFTQLNWVLILVVVLYLGVMTLAIGLCDFLVGIFVLPIKLLELTAPPHLSILNDGLCTAVTYLQTVVVFSSVLTLVATCIESHNNVVLSRLV
uniref:G-protein coupled receptors family 1 profile domain-containing protein n=1 Tax=Strigamia maritima TaxID=126957 RepID=T1JIX3_STRMM